MTKKTRILYVVSHAIQYQAPLLRLISKSPDIAIKAIFYGNITAQSNFDPGFGQAVQWDVPLLTGYAYQYLMQDNKHTGRLQKLHTLWKIIDAREADVIWTHGYADLFTIAAICFAKLKGLKVFVRGESMIFPDQKKTTLKTRKRQYIFRWLDKCIDKYLAIGTNNTNFYQTMGISQDKIAMCHYAVDNDFFREKYLTAKEKIKTLKAKLNLDENRPIILYASKFITRKCPIDLLNAYARLSKNGDEPNPYLLFIGNGEQYAAVKAQAAQYRWHSIQFLGFKNQSELPDYYTIADVFVLPSLHENWGLVINEAMNAQCAIIVSDHIGCAPDLVQHGVNGYVYPARDANTLAKYLQAVTTNTTQCKNMQSKSGDIITQWGLADSLSGLREACKSAQRT